MKKKKLKKKKVTKRDRRTDTQNLPPETQTFREHMNKNTGKKN